MWQYLRKNFGYDAGHVLQGVILAVVLLVLFGNSWLAAFGGAYGYGLPKELWDRKQDGKWQGWSTVSDLLADALGAIPLIVTLYGSLQLGAVAFVSIGLAYLGAVALGGYKN